ncbi:MAG: DUF6194 family protein [Anaerolineae bacterium]
MNQSEVEAFVARLDNVQRDENYGYIFFFIGDDHQRGFVTIANSDNEYDSVSNLNRDGVFRVNIGVSKATYKSVIGSATIERVDFTALNEFLPHPDYWKQHYVCILNPTAENEELTKELIIEAHSIAANRLKRKRNS